MTHYTVVAGDLLWDIAIKFATTTDIILRDNPEVDPLVFLEPGQDLLIRTPDEVAAEQADDALSAADDASAVFDEALGDGEPATLTDAFPVVWRGAPVDERQTGMLRILRPLPLAERLEDNTFGDRLMLQEQEVFRTFQILTGTWETEVDGEDQHFTTAYQVGDNQWVYDIDGYVEFFPLPEEVTSVLGKTLITPNVVGEQERRVPPNTPYFEPRNYTRPILQIQRDGKIITMELRVLSSSANRSILLQQGRTNGGYFINVGGSTLPVIVIQGVFLDTKTNQEFDDFMLRYQQYIDAYRDGDFYSSAICTLFYKGREYRSLIAAFSYNDSTSSPMLPGYTLQFLVLKEKGPGQAATPAPLAKTKLLNGFDSELQYLLLNPITGLYGTEVGVS